MKLLTRIALWRLRPHAKVVYHALEDPDAWNVGEYRLVHKRSNKAFWVGNGASHFALKDPEIDCFSTFEKRVLWRKYKAMLYAKMFSEMSGLS